MGYKHYNGPITPKTALLKIGKMIYYTYKKEFSVPKNYYFVSPKGAGPQLSKLIDKPNDFKKKLLKEWDKTCKDDITKKEQVLLEGDFKDYLESFDFSIIKDIEPQELIVQHSETRYHFYRFGGIIPSRPESFLPPDDINEHEQIYVEKLLEAYSVYHKNSINTTLELNQFDTELNHFIRQKNVFLKLKSLKLFERDILPDGINAFEELKNDVFEGIIDHA
ncbi:hypothetical protein AS030_12445 [Fictibacillus enclensis]|uniref:ABC-three component systems C-terminal domain-containing protein n=1 Tax=Fictibacillus enclensis TaxID=1017270 RepID=A0A0V8J925_9BACL|nr:ABC-three component system protein [Fictibacillus enclensis]KSU83372.1 hypothetical protein AS030_12445 [Fictibacillus enclensis]